MQSLMQPHKGKSLSCERQWSPGMLQHDGNLTTWGSCGFISPFRSPWQDLKGEMPSGTPVRDCLDQVRLWGCLGESVLIGLFEVERPTLKVGGAIPCTWICNCGKGRKPAEYQHASLSASWLWTWCDQLPQAPAAVTAPTCWTVSQNYEPKKLFLP